MKGKDFVKREAANAASKALHGGTQYNAPQKSPFFLGQISDDQKTIVDTTSGQTYNLQFTGNPREFEMAMAISPYEAVVNAAQINVLNIDGQLKSLVLGVDSTYYYLRHIGQGTKYYLPLNQDFQDITGAISTNIASSGIGQFGNNNNFQGLISSDGNAVLLGTVLQNSHTLANMSTAITDPGTSVYHQFAHYYIASGLQFVPYTSALFASNPAFITDLLYPVPIDQGYFVVTCTSFQSSVFNLNSFADGKVPAPDPGVPNVDNGSQGLWFPHATAQSGGGFFNFNHFNPNTNFSWHGDSGYVYIETDYAICAYPWSGQKKTTGSQNYTWQGSPNHAVFTSFQYVLNNESKPATSTDTKVVYTADIVLTFVNGYLFTMNNTNWTETFSYKEDVLGVTGPCQCPGETYGEFYSYSEFNDYSYLYKYDVDFIYLLHYYQTPDVWLTTADITSTLLNPKWQKTQTRNSYSTGGGICPPYNYTSTASWDAYCWSQEVPPFNDKCWLNGPPALGAGFAFAYATTNTGTRPFGGLPAYADEGFGPGGVANFSYYSGIQTRGVFDVQAGLSWPGYYLAYYGGTAQYNWIDLNYDQLFGLTTPNYYAIYAGRSSMIINNLNNNLNVGNNSVAPVPTLYGIVTQLLGDGTDLNKIYTAFKGRTPDPDHTNANTAFVYLQGFNGIYHYSSPWLVSGNLSNLQQSDGFSLSPSNDPYTQAIVQLVDWSSLAGAYGDTATETAINDLISAYRGLTPDIPPPSAAAIANVIAKIDAMDPDLIPAASALQNSLLAINAGIAGNNAASIQPDMVGFKPPDIYTDKIFSFGATFPFQPYDVDSRGFTVSFNRYLKAVDSYLVQEYYVNTVTNTEVIQGFNISDGSQTQAGLTTQGKRVSGSYPFVGAETLIDYVIPISPSALLT